MQYSNLVWLVPTVAAGTCAWVVALVLVMTRKLHGCVSGDLHKGVQRNHCGLTPRIGGVPLVAGVSVGYYFSQGEVANILRVMTLSGVLAFGFGLLEDLTKRVSVRVRLVATIGSGLLAWALSGIAINDIDLPVWGSIGLLLPFSVIFTAFAVGGVANAINLIDGFNGLAAGTVIVQLCSIGLLAIFLGDAQLAVVCLILASATLGFMLLNWPYGRLFLGDGGAYFLGFCVAWVSVLLLYRHSDVSAWCPYVDLDIKTLMQRTQ